MSINLSASSIKDFLLCSQRYFYRVNSSGISEQSDGMLVGSTVHHVLEKCWNKEYDTAISCADDYLTNNNISFSDKYYYGKIEKSLDNFFMYYKEMLTDSDLVETKFKIKHAPNIYFVGRIDRIVIMPNGNNLLIDWKTSNKDPFKIDDDIQFLLYKYAYIDLYGREPSRILYINLFTNKMLALNYSEESYSNLFSVTVPYILNRVKNNDFVREGLNKKNVCKYCPFRTQCFADGGITKKL